MAYGNNSGNNNAGQKFEVSTRGISFFAHQENEPNTVVRVSCKFYGDLFSLALANPTMTGDGKMTFPRENNIPISLKPEKAYGLYDIIKNEICPAIDENRATTRAIYLDKRKTNALVLRVIPTDGVALPRIVMLYLSGFSNGRPDKGQTVEFPKSEYFTACGDDGYMEESNECHTYFMMFTYALHAYCMAHGGGFAHSERASNQYMNDKITGYLNSIANRLGVQTAPQGGYGNYNSPTPYTTGNSTWAPPTIPEGAAPRPASEVSSLDDLPF